MKEEEKELLTEDLCERLPFGLKVLADLDKEFDGGIIGTLSGIYWKEWPLKKKELYVEIEKGVTGYTIEEVRPYLRPMTSMTESEFNTFLYHNFSDRSATHFTPECVSWLKMHHFDYRGLIPRGLAIKVTEENNPYK